jgi:tRNA (pseudouridine54-N1)-methyltransferase
LRSLQNDGVRLVMREFVLYSRLGRTDANFGSLHEAGRLDIVYECAVASLFLSHAIRKDVVFHTLLSGPPVPPLHLRMEGATLHDVRTDQQTWERILRKVLGGQTHPGITADRTSFEALLKTEAEASRTVIYVLEEKGRNVSEVEMSENTVFVLGDHIGLPKTVENFALRYAEKISLGKRPYLAASCITILNYLMDRKARC